MRWSVEEKVGAFTSGPLYIHLFFRLVNTGASHFFVLVRVCNLLYTDTNLALHYYSHDNAKTENGVLKITTERKENAYRAFNEKTKKFYNDKKYIQSAMMQSWNKFCFTGGIVEISAKLPGSPRIGGLWPARTSYPCPCLHSGFECTE